MRGPGLDQPSFNLFIAQRYFERAQMPPGASSAEALPLRLIQVSNIAARPVAVGVEEVLLELSPHRVDQRVQSLLRDAELGSVLEDLALDQQDLLGDLRQVGEGAVVAGLRRSQRSVDD